MKKIILIFTLLTIFQSQAQVLSYEQLALVFATEQQQGSARSMGMKNSFGALGGDLSALSINPAGGAVFANSMGSFTLGVDNSKVNADFYGVNTNNSNTELNLSQVGGVLVFDNNYAGSDSNWNRIVVGLNISTMNNFNNTWTANGISSPTWDDDYEEDEITSRYTNVEHQQYTTTKSGSHTVLNWNASALYKDYLYVGVSINSYDIDFREDSELNEKANDGSGNTVEAYQKFWVSEKGGGISLGAGVIVKPTQNIRLGLAYTSPVWYEIDGESNVFAEDDFDAVGYYNSYYSDGEITYENSDTKATVYMYDLRTPSKLTGSLAYVFGKKGLVSIDVTKKDYTNIKLGPETDYIDENINFDTDLQNTYGINLGAEWRVKKLSLRGGYSYTQTPYAYNIDTDNIQGYAFGMGYNFGRLSLDFAYDYSENTDEFNFYPGKNGTAALEINPAQLSLNSSKFISTIAYVF